MSTLIKKNQFFLSYNKLTKKELLFQLLQCCINGVALFEYNVNELVYSGYLSIYLGLVVARNQRL